MKRIQVLGLDLYGCHEALARLDDYVDRELSPDETRRVAAHLRICAQCARKFHQEAQLLQGLRERIARVEVEGDTGALKSKIAELLAKERGAEK